MNEIFYCSLCCWAPPDGFLSLLPPLAKRNKTSGMGDRPTSHTVAVAVVAVVTETPVPCTTACSLLPAGPWPNSAPIVLVSPSFQAGFWDQSKGALLGCSLQRPSLLCPPSEERDDKIHLVGATERCPQQDLETSASVLVQYFQVLFLLRVAFGDAFLTVAC